MPALGYGIRYEFGIFDQVIRDGWQCERTDKCLRNGNPWDIARTEIAYEVKFGGRTEAWVDEQGRFRARWNPETEVRGVACDTPIAGYRCWHLQARVSAANLAAFAGGQPFLAETGLT